MTIKTLKTKTTKSAIARRLDVREGTVRYHVVRMEADAVDGRSKQTYTADALAEAIDFWRLQHRGSLNLASCTSGCERSTTMTEAFDLCSGIGADDIQRPPSGRGGGWRRLLAPRFRSIGRYSLA